MRARGRRKAGVAGSPAPANASVVGALPSLPSLYSRVADAGAGANIDVTLAAGAGASAAATATRAASSSAAREALRAIGWEGKGWQWQWELVVAGCPSLCVQVRERCAGALSSWSPRGEEAGRE